MGLSGPSSGVLGTRKEILDTSETQLVEENRPRDAKVVDSHDYLVTLRRYHWYHSVAPQPIPLNHGNTNSIMSCVTLRSRQSARLGFDLTFHDRSQWLAASTIILRGLWRRTQACSELFSTHDHVALSVGLLVFAANASS